MNKKNIQFGLNPLPEDRRDVTVGAIKKLPKLEELPSEFSLPNQKILDQNGFDFCAAYASVVASKDQEKVDLDPYYQFAVTKEIEGDYKSFGANLRDMAKSLTKVGSIEERDAPFDGSKGRNFLANLKNYPEELKEKAKEHLKESYLFVDGKYDYFDNIRATIWEGRNENKSVVIGVRWCYEWTTLDGIIDKEGTPQEGHAINVRGWVVRKGKTYLKIQNSWGDSNGDKGIYYISREVINKNKRYGGITFTDIKKEALDYMVDNGIKEGDNWFVQLIKTFRSLFRRLGARSRQWKYARKTFLANNPCCAVCGTKKKLEVHHVLPYHLYPEFELSYDNLITLCRRDHFLFGHLCNWKKFNKFVVEDAKRWYKKIHGTI